MAAFFLLIVRKSGEVVPVRVRERVVAVEVRQAAVRNAVVQVAERQPQRADPAKHSHISFTLLLIVFFSGARPLWAAYAAHSPLLPFGERRARKNQVAFESAQLPRREDKPPSATPLNRLPNASISRVPVVPLAFI